MLKLNQQGYLYTHYTKLNYLAASPDGLIGNDEIVEIKCPQSIKDYTPEEAVNNKKLKYMIYNNEKLILKKNNCYYINNLILQNENGAIL